MGGGGGVGEGWGQGIEMKPKHTGSDFPRAASPTALMLTSLIASALAPKTITISTNIRSVDSQSFWFIPHFTVSGTTPNFCKATF